MEPAIRLVPRGEVVDELDMAPAAGELLRPQHLVGRKRERAEALQRAEVMPRHLVARGVVKKGGDRQAALRRRHRRRQQDRAPRLRRQNRRRQEEALPHEAAELGNARIGSEVGALDIDMGDAASRRPRHLVTRPHHVFAGAQLDLLRPARPRQELGDVERIAGERRDRPLEAEEGAVAHEVEADGACRNGARVTVLHPERHPLALVRRR